MPTVDSPVVARMKAAGTVILGKTNVPVLSQNDCALQSDRSGIHRARLSERRVESSQRHG